MAPRSDSASVVSPSCAPRRSVWSRLVCEKVTRESLITLRDDLDDLRIRLDESKRRAGELPHREQYLRIVVDFLRGFLELHEQLVAQVERELAPARRPSRVTTRPGSAASQRQ